MATNLVTATEDQLVVDVFAKMREAKLRMLPVLSPNGCITGVISTFCMMEYVIPEYVTSGDLNQISYAPDMGILRRHYTEIASQPIKNVMSKKPLLVQPNESLLSVAAALSSFGRHEYAMVVDKDNKLLGIISAGDILDRLQVKASEEYDA
ncbi:MAG: CBS domain-containing protein [Ghiorsea sp.]